MQQIELFHTSARHSVNLINDSPMLCEFLTKTMHYLFIAHLSVLLRDLKQTFQRIRLAESHVTKNKFPILIRVCNVSFATHRPYLWGASALEHYKQKQELGWLLWKQPGMQEVMELLDRKCLFQSVSNFPVHLGLEVELDTYCHVCAIRR